MLLVFLSILLNLLWHVVVVPPFFYCCVVLRLVTVVLKCCLTQVSNLSRLQKRTCFAV